MTAPAIEPRVLGKPINRVDGRLKVTGAAQYAAEFNPPGVLHGYALTSRISNGRIAEIDTTAAEAAPGVKAVLTHRNAPKLQEPKPAQQGGGGIRNENRLPLSDDKIHYGGQYVAMVVAETPEQARHAASLIKITYEQSTPSLQRRPDDKGNKPRKTTATRCSSKRVTWKKRWVTELTSSSSAFTTHPRKRTARWNLPRRSPNGWRRINLLCTTPRST